MWSRGYMTFGALVLFGYALTSWEGWEPFSRRFQALPGLSAAASGGGGVSSGRAPGSGYSSHPGASGFGGGK
ncbi:MAG TPA: hypothetical protein VFE78_11460 [Gemmataceae bacterium]|jgi:hypothetical protein|nr:hypothetical protein [Gemmataceae bacterium]